MVNRLRYDEVVSPSRIVAIPGYFSRLLPEIGARSAWLYVGWRQAVWNGERGNEGGSRSRRIAVSQVTRYSGLGRRTFFRATEDPATWQALAGLVERQDLTPHWTQGRDRRSHRLPNKYTVHMTLPLTQADSRSVMEWLTERIRSGSSLLDALKQAAEVKELVGELLPLAGPVPDQNNAPSPDRDGHCRHLEPRRSVPRTPGRPPRNCTAKSSPGLAQCSSRIIFWRRSFPGAS